MAEIKLFENHKKGLELGGKIKEVINLNQEKYMKNIEVPDNWKKDSVKAFKNFMNYNVKCSLFDIALIFNGISENKSISKEVRLVAEKILVNTPLINIIDNELLAYKKSAKRNKKKYNEVDHLNGGFYIDSLNYFKAIIENPGKISEYDLLILIFALMESKQLEVEHYKYIKGMLEEQCGIDINEVLLNEREYKQSLMSKYIKQPNESNL
ncbi:hypothetical protein ACY2DA_13320 [Staphylococcus simulans]